MNKNKQKGFFIQSIKIIFMIVGMIALCILFFFETNLNPINNHNGNNHIFEDNTPEEISILKDKFFLGRVLVQPLVKTKEYQYEKVIDINGSLNNFNKIKCKVIKEHTCYITSIKMRYAIFDRNKDKNDIKNEVIYFNKLYQNFDDFLISVDKYKTYKTYSDEIFKHHFSNIIMSFSFEDKIFFINIDKQQTLIDFIQK